MAAIIVQKHSQKASQEDISRILSELEALSEMEAQQMLDREMQNKH
jgi:hypothetical protein